MKLLVTLLLLLPSLVSAQDWQFSRTITFPVTGDDTLKVRPYLSAVALDGTLYVISSSATDTSAHNALWKAAPGATVLELVDDFTADKDAIVGSVRGITTLGNNVLVSHQQRPPSQVGGVYYYPNGARGDRITITSAAGFAGYGTYPFGLSGTDQGFVYAALSFQTSMRVYNYSNFGQAGWAGWVPMDPVANTETGGHDNCGLSALRDIATIPQGAYATDNTLPFFTSRNATPTTADAACVQYDGAVSVWVGGTSATPRQYVSQRLADPAGDLRLSAFVSSGIAADKAGRVWVARPDTLSRWVKAFSLFGTFATDEFELPSATSVSNPVEGGAPFNQPVDVALNRAESIAYVTDRGARAVHVFEDRNAVSVDAFEVPGVARLDVLYPQPARFQVAIPFAIERPGTMRLSVFDVLGREVAVLAEGLQPAGAQTQVVQVSDMAPGLYHVRLNVEGRTLSRPMMVVR